MSKNGYSKKITTLYVILVSVLLFSCKNEDKEIENQFLKTTINEIAINDKIHTIIILPGLGCPGCIQTAEEFMRIK